MNFLALIVGLTLERLLTQLFRLRAFHWLDPIFDSAFKNLRIAQPNVAILAAILLVAIVVIPVGLIEYSLQGRLVYIPQFLFAVIVLVFCLGPRDLAETVADFGTAAENKDSAKINDLCAELLERDPEPGEEIEVDEAIYAQANNRIFGVVFWFVLLGPTGAWLFRVLDLMQRRAVRFNHSIVNNNSLDQESATSPDGQGKATESWSRVVAAAILLHRVFAWVPGRLLALGFFLGGNFNKALGAWGDHVPHESTLFPGPTDQLLGAVGSAAAEYDGTEDRVDRANIALSQVERTLWFIWCPILALMTLYDFLS